MPTPNYFEFYGLPESFRPDVAALKRQYYALSREYHPDFHATATPEKQQEILHLATLNTNAYRILSDADQRMAYILGHHGLLEEGKQELPSDFLMEVMELNEQLMELEFEPDSAAVERLSEEVNILSNTLESGIEPVLAGYDGLPHEARPQALTQVRTYYLKKRYLLRIRESLAKFATRS
ncbi:iron-sulfur cluster co-chaperone HscB C-terminal domain-containing protein [Hymenobacter endophyticus]|uniref:Iron-sulfur cluster co-chaperone HscB C-terminal domain-containing protein n=1 Tax=Hymenobacter endophyticus TaxID=3076335 RepID=A0ABU3TIX3_9BACT|nr:iron-sulfur cluster co-chaperone HscB C-terminal domain-containing protein [Hymenobacter endophyticus]MDU0371329.1 iron-sulfur cluster co-chaperone HscB C-terminal domain-containing protein [Hymenobacter endophyticus]